MLSQIKPYLSLIKLGISAALLVAAFVGGCTYKGNKEESKRQELQTKIDFKDREISSLNEFLNQVNADLAVNKKAAEAQQKIAEQATEQARKNKQQLDRKQAEWDKKSKQIKNDPNCTELLQRQLCPLLNTY